MRDKKKFSQGGNMSDEVIFRYSKYIRGKLGIDPKKVQPAQYAYKYD